MSHHAVKDLLRVRQSHVVTEDITLREVAERLIISDCDVVAVTDQNQRLTGIVCESAVVRALLANPTPGATIRSIVTHHATSIGMDASLNSVLPLFRTSAHTAIPVVDRDGRVCGLLMRRDVIGTILNHRVDEAQPLLKPRSETAGTRTAQGSTPSAVIPKPPAELSSAPGSMAEGPHFLRADSARRILWASEDRL